MVAFFPAKWAGNPVKKYALANVRLHVAVCSPAVFAGSVAK